MVSNYFSLHGGGIELVAGKLVESMAMRGTEVVWAAYASGLPACSAVPLLPLRGSNIIEEKTGLPFPVLSFSCQRALKRAVSTADVVHVHDCIYESSRVAAYHAIRLQKPVVVTQHIGEMGFRSRVKRLAYATANVLLTKPLLRRASRIVFISDNVRRYYSAALADSPPPEMVFNGLDPSTFRHLGSRQEQRSVLKIDATGPVALFVGRFVEKKGLDRVRRLAAARPEVRWYLIGRGPLDPTSWKLPNVVVLGQQSQQQIVQWFNASDLLVLLSTGEGFPLVVQESLASGCPVLVSDEIATACSAISDHIYRVAPDFSDMNEVYDQALGARPESDQERCRRAAHFAGTWNWQRCTDRYLDIYRSLLSDHAR